MTTPVLVTADQLSDALTLLGLTELFSIAAIRITRTHIDVDRYVYTRDHEIRRNLLTEQPMTVTTRVQVIIPAPPATATEPS